MQDENFVDVARLETTEWLESMTEVLERSGPGRVVEILRELSMHAHANGVQMPFTANTPYVNTITTDQQPPYPGNLELEERLAAAIRWNAMAMVVRANREEKGIGGHIATYASAATLWEVGFHHFFRARSEEHPGDFVYFQGHAAPGIYARAFLEGRLSEGELSNFRRELADTPGLSSYPHPWLMPDFWQFPTVSMGLGPIAAIYHARFIKYLEDRGLKAASDSKVWAFVGDGETDEPETLGAITLASRENLDNLIFVINCNLQRLDGPVRGNGKVIQDLEAAFRGAGWNVVKVIWGSDWDALLAKDTEGLLRRRMLEVVDGQFQKYVVESGAYFRDHFFGADPALKAMVEHLTDDQLKRLTRGGHDAIKVFAAYEEATKHTGAPTVILAKTIKGYGMGDAGEGLNVAHQQKSLEIRQLLNFRTRFGLPMSDEDVEKVPFYMPPEDSAEMQYMHQRRKTLGGYLPKREGFTTPLPTPTDEYLKEFFAGTGDRHASTTMAYTRMLAKLLQSPEIGRYIVPMIPDEARTFGMDALFRQVGIYAHSGQLYEPVDRANLLYYKEAKDGQILEEGITEAGCLCSFIAAGTAYSNHGVPTIPFFTYYSMFGLQRVGDLVWAAADSRVKGFLMAATAGRTTLAGEGLQHQDGHSHVLALTIPNMMAYDPAYAYEVAVILQEGIRRMYTEGEDIFYYVTLLNEDYVQPPMPEGCREGILKGLYKVRDSKKPAVQLMGSGSILPETLKAADMLKAEFGIDAVVWSATSYKELYNDASSADRWNRLHPDQKPRTPYVTKCLGKSKSPVVAASDYMRVLPESVSHWIPNRLITLGTDGFGRSEGRAALRDFFEVDAKHIAHTALVTLVQEGQLQASVAVEAAEKWNIKTETPDPVKV